MRTADCSDCFEVATHEPDAPTGSGVRLRLVFNDRSEGATVALARNANTLAGLSGRL